MYKFTVLLITCWTITPLAMVSIGLLFESRLIPLINPRKQFLSFFPGDLFLGVAVAIVWNDLTLLQNNHQWYLSLWWYAVLLCLATTIAIVVTTAEYKSGFFPHRAILSPTKLYHNIALYGGYGSFVIYSSIATCLGTHAIINNGDIWIKPVIAIIPFVFWIAMLIIERYIPRGADSTRRLNAHVANWQPLFWRI